MEAAQALNRPALVLNKNWTPIQTTTVKEAISLVAKGSARILEPETYEMHDLKSWNDASSLRAKLGEDVVIRSSKLAIVPPEVIILTQYDKLAQRSVVFSRKNLFKRDRYTCQYCGSQPGPDALTIDHIVPRSKGGTSTWENCVLACVDCNKKKADLPLDKCGLKLRKKPIKPSWKVLMQVNPKVKRESWDQFLSRNYWEVELEP